jgi:uncharacterized protein (DUF2235 family)
MKGDSYMRNLVVCCDRTWNTPDQETYDVPTPSNVFRLYSSLEDKDRQGNDQLRYYHPGVGTYSGLLGGLFGGGVGAGLGKNIQSAYRWLGYTYQNGDRIFLFGFSRGAFTVRSLSGMMDYCGLLDLSDLSDNELWKRIRAAYEHYRQRKPMESEVKDKLRRDWAPNWKFHDLEGTGRVPIHFLGVWDTVGALGIPDDMGIFNIFDRPKKYRFHSTTLSDSVTLARHAVGIDEMRSSYTPSLWINPLTKEPIQNPPRVKQVWFPGVHCDIGGGYLQKGMSDAPLKWMMDEADAAGLYFRNKLYLQIHPRYCDVQHNSYTKGFQLLGQKTQPRRMPRINSSYRRDDVHESAYQRQDDPPIEQTPYRLDLSFGPPEKKLTRLIFARDHWSYPFVYLEKGVIYRFSTEGQWLDNGIKYGPDGKRTGNFNRHYVRLPLSWLWRKMGALIRDIRRNKKADMLGTLKRQADMPYFAMVGVIANGGNPDYDGTALPHETFLIGNGCTYSPKESGYFYCFANQCWRRFEKNSGCITLIVKEVKRAQTYTEQQYNYGEKNAHKT